MLALIGIPKSKHRLHYVTRLFMLRKHYDAVIGSDQFEYGIFVCWAPVLQYLLDHIVTVRVAYYVTLTSNDAAKDLRSLRLNTVLNHPLHGSAAVRMLCQEFNRLNDFFYDRVDAI